MTSSVGHLHVLSMLVSGPLIAFFSFSILSHQQKWSLKFEYCISAATRMKISNVT